MSIKKTSTNSTIQHYFIDSKHDFAAILEHGNIEQHRLNRIQI